MSFKIIRNDITKMNTEAIVNTASRYPGVGTGCDIAVYKAAGYEQLFAYRAEHIGFVPEGEVFITPGFGLKAKYIIHAVSPLYMGGNKEEEKKLRSCYRKSLQIAKENNIHSIAFPLIATGGFGYPKEDGMRIAIDEIKAFLSGSTMQIYLVVFDDEATMLGRSVYPDLEAYINRNYVERVRKKEYGDIDQKPILRSPISPKESVRDEWRTCAPTASISVKNESKKYCAAEDTEQIVPVFEELHERKLEERMKHISDTYSEYLMYLIRNKGMENAEVWRRAIVDKKVFSKIKNDPAYHPKKLTALCLCIGAKLNLDETRDLLARAGYALSPCDKTDIIFSYFIENKIYDMIELDIQLEEHGLPCIIT